MQLGSAVHNCSNQNRVCTMQTARSCLQASMPNCTKTHGPKSQGSAESPSLRRCTGISHYLVFTSCQNAAAVRFSTYNGHTIQHELSPRISNKAPSRTSGIKQTKSAEEASEIEPNAESPTKPKGVQQEEQLQTNKHAELNVDIYICIIV